MNKKVLVDILTNVGIERNEADKEVEMILEYFANYTAKDLLMGKELDTKLFEIVKDKVELRAKTRQPIQHIIGFANFMGEDFIVNPSVLIPRDETEILVRSVVDIIKKNDFGSALDVGTGSGCIACMIAKLTDCRVIGLDISNDALRTALENASRLNLFNKAIFRKSDVFSKVRDYEKFDIIVSNPPYISPKEKQNIQKEVSFDPENALYTSDDKGLEFYERISKDAHKFLNPKGFVAFEIGINQAEYVSSILQKYEFENINIIKDLAGIERVICANLK